MDERAMPRETVSPGSYLGKTALKSAIGKGVAIKEKCSAQVQEHSEDLHAIHSHNRKRRRCTQLASVVSTGDGRELYNRTTEMALVQANPDPKIGFYPGKTEPERTQRGRICRGRRFHTRKKMGKVCRLGKSAAWACEGTRRDKKRISGGGKTVYVEHYHGGGLILANSR